MASNDFNLNISRYVDATEPVEVMSVEDALNQLREAEEAAGRGRCQDGRVAGGDGVCPIGHSKPRLQANITEYK